MIRGYRAVCEMKVSLLQAKPRGSWPVTVLGGRGRKTTTQNVVEGF